MRPSALAAALHVALTSAPAWATPAQDTVRRLAATLRADAPGLRASLRAPLLGGQLSALRDGLKSLVDEKSVAACAAKPVEDEIDALQAELRRSPRLNGVSAADKTLKIAEDARDLLSASTAAVPGYVPD